MKMIKPTQRIRERFMLLGGFSGNHTYISPLAVVLNDIRGPLGELAAKKPAPFTLSEAFKDLEKLRRTTKGTSVIILGLTPVLSGQKGLLKTAVVLIKNSLQF